MDKMYIKKIHKEYHYGNNPTTTLIQYAQINQEFHDKTDWTGKTKDSGKSIKKNVIRASVQSLKIHHCHTSQALQRTWFSQHKCEN